MLMPPLAPSVTLKGEPIKIRFVKDLVSTTNTGPLFIKEYHSMVSRRNMSQTIPDVATLELNTTQGLEG